MGALNTTMKFHQSSLSCSRTSTNHRVVKSSTVENSLNFRNEYGSPARLLPVPLYLYYG